MKELFSEYFCDVLLSLVVLALVFMGLALRRARNISLESWAGRTPRAGSELNADGVAAELLRFPRTALRRDCVAIVVRLHDEGEPMEFGRLESALVHAAFLEQAVSALSTWGLVEIGINRSPHRFLRLSEKGEAVARLVVQS